MNIQKFADLQISDRLLRAIRDAGFSEPTPIQAKAIPTILARTDILGIAQTGTGKTAAFTLPLLQNLVADGALRQQEHRPAALILAPTRELVLQISENLAAHGRHLAIRHAVIIGGVSQGQQVQVLRRGVDIVIATPGRLMDLIRQRHADISNCRYLILDEADRMLDMGFIRDIRQIAALLPRKRQTMLFSATMPAEIAKLGDELLTDPQRIEASPKKMTAETIDQRIVHVDATKKRALLRNMLALPDFTRVIVFTRTKHGADKVARNLQSDGIAAVALHGNKSQNARQRAVKQFSGGTARVLVATDIASRGIDISSISHVINYELPEVPESYVHRIGRTARASNTGTAISFCDARDQASLRAIERYIRQSLPMIAEHEQFSGELLAGSVRSAISNDSPGRMRSHRRRRTRRLAA